MLFEDEKVEMTNSQLTTEINNLKNQLSLIQARLDSIYGTETTAVKAENQVVMNVNKVSDKASYEYVDFNVKKDEAGVAVSWDVTQFEKSLPATHKLRDVRIVGDTKDRSVFNHNKKQNTVILDSGVANPQVEVRLKIESPEGVYRYDSVQILDTTTDGAKVLAVNATIPTEARSLTLSEVNDRLMAEISKLRKEVS